MGQRLHKVLAERGIASRRKAEALIAAGRVSVNGVIARVGQSVEESDVVALDEVIVRSDVSRVYVALHKPIGVISAASAPHHEVTVTQLAPLPERLYPVGRLDKDSSGLLFLTNDGGWANLVGHPRYGVEKEYDVLVDGLPRAADIAQLEMGIRLPDGSITSTARVIRVGELHGRSRFSVTVIEGKKRQIRLMFAALGHPVIELKRTRVGPIELGSLPPGAWRRLTQEEVSLVRHAASKTAPGGASPVTSDRRGWPRLRG